MTSLKGLFLSGGFGKESNDGKPTDLESIQFLEKSGEMRNLSVKCGKSQYSQLIDFGTFIMSFAGRISPNEAENELRIFRKDGDSLKLISIDENHDLELYIGIRTLYMTNNKSQTNFLRGRRRDFKIKLKLRTLSFTGLQ